MSRTRKTDPWWVKMMHNPDLVREVHNHKNNDCDLPENAKLERLSDGSNLCWYSALLVPNSCSCFMCNPINVHARRSERRKSKIETNLLTKELRVLDTLGEEEIMEADPYAQRIYRYNKYA